MVEKWKDIKGYEGNYKISNRGRVFSQFRGGIMKAIDIRSDGYNTVTLSKNNKSKTYYVHRLVANYFIPTVEGKTQVNHIDFNKSNNNVSNLEWVNIEDNNKHSYNAGRYFNNEYQKIEVLHKDGTINVYPSIVQTSKAIGCHRDTIYNYWKLGYSPRLKELNIRSITKLEWQRG